MNRAFPIILLSFTYSVLTGCSKTDPTAEAQQTTVQRVDDNIDSLRIVVEKAREEGKKWKTDRWREAFARFDTADAPIARQLEVIGSTALTPPYQPDTIKARLEELASKRVEIGRLKYELTEIARKTKNGKAVIAPPASATTEGAKTPTRK